MSEKCKDCDEKIKLLIGPRGKRGYQGIQGIPGTPGVSGGIGTPGIQGPQGNPGVNGTNGTNGTNGVDGINGTNGVDGVIASIVQLDSSVPIVNTIIENTLVGTLTSAFEFPVASLTVGSTFLLKAFGNFNSILGGGTDITIRLKSNGLTIASTATLAVSNYTNQHWSLDLIITVRSIGVVGILSITGTFINSTSGVNINVELFSNLPVLNTTILNTLDLTAQWTIADPNNEINTDTFVFTKLN